MPPRVAPTYADTAMRDRLQVRPKSCWRREGGLVRCGIVSCGCVRGYSPIRFRWGAKATLLCGHLAMARFPLSAGYLYITSHLVYEIQNLTLLWSPLAVGDLPHIVVVAHACLFHCRAFLPQSVRSSALALRQRSALSPVPSLQTQAKIKTQTGHPTGPVLPDLGP